MREDIKKRLEQVQVDTIPVGYQSNKRVGTAPEEWKFGTLSNVVKNIRRPIAKPDTAYWRLGIRSHAKGTFHELVEDPETVSMDELFLVEEDDLIINITFAWEHAIALANANDAGKLVSHRFPTYVFKKGQVPKYFSKVVIQPRFKELLANISPGGAGRNRVLSKIDFLKLPCYIPPEKEQQKIAEILNHCDKVIELKQQLIEEERNRKKWLMQNLLDPDSGVRLPGFVEPWVDTLIKDVSTVISGGTPSTNNPEYWDGHILWCTPTDISKTNKYISSTGQTISELGLKNSSATLLPIGTVLMCSRASIGPRAIATKEISTNQGFKSFICSKNLNNEFLYYLIDVILPDLLKLASGNTFRELSKDSVDNFKITIPDTCEQNAIADILIAQDNKIELLEQELTQWQQKKKSLMQLLLTGLVRVTV